MAEGVQEDENTNEGQEGLSPETLALAEKGREGFNAAAPAPAAQGTQRPDNIPEQFWDPAKGEVRTEALLKSYTDLRKAFDGRKPADKEAAEGKQDEGAEGNDSVKIGDQKTEGEEGKQPPEQAKVAEAISAARDAYAKTGELTDDHRKALVDAGFDDSTIDVYLAGVKALEEGIRASVYDVAGGKDKYQAAVAWAADNWSAAEITEFDKAIVTEGGRKLAVNGLLAAFSQANPGEGDRVHADNDGRALGDVYRSAEEFTQDLRKADDASDAVARRKAMDKLERSKRAGTIERVGDRRSVKFASSRRN